MGRYLGHEVEARVTFRCGCSTHYPRIFQRFLAQYVQECREHGNRQFLDNPGDRTHVDTIRIVERHERTSQ